MAFAHFLRLVIIIWRINPRPISGLPFADFLVAKYVECISDVRGYLYFFIEWDFPVLRSSNATENGRTTSQSSKHTVPISYTATLYYKYRCSLIVLSRVIWASMNPPGQAWGLNKRCGGDSE